MLPRIPLGTAVMLHGVYVTALRPVSASSNGFFVQDPSLEPYSGLSVFSGSVTLGVEVGQRLTVRGYAESFQGTPELTEPAVELEQAAAALPLPAVFLTDPAAIADGGALFEAYRSMLVTFSGLSVTSENADAPSDFDEFVATGGLRVDDALDPDLDNTFPVGTRFSSLRGIVGQSFSHRKLWPRSSADIEP